MVFDWFNRGVSSGESRAAAPEEAEAPPPDSAEQPPASPASPPPPAETPQAPSIGAVDEDALAWAREAYARLRAQQEAARSPAPPPPAEVAPAQAEVIVHDSPPAPPEAAPSPPAPPSLLELADAQRSERIEQLIAAPAASPAAAPVPAAAPPAPALEESEAQLGAFDQEFTWSAEVLAAQGRRIEEMSVEEIDWLSRLRRGLQKTRRNFVTQLLENLGDDPLTPEVLDELETALLRADVGVQATDRVLEALRRRLNEEVVDPAEGVRFLKDQLRGLLDGPIERSGHPLLAPRRDRLNVWLLVGVNGVGKTTTLGKLANLAVRSGYTCLIAAADTFRAAAVQQVTIWGERSGVPVISNPSTNSPMWPREL